MFSANPNQDSAPSPHEEILLMRRAQANPKAFAPLYDHYFERVYAYCAHRVNNPQEAEDLCSQVFLNILKSLHTYQGGMVAAWIFTIARHVVAHHYRSEKPIISLDGLDFATHDIAPLLDVEEEKRIIRELVSALPTEKRDLLHLMLDSGLSSSEIGGMMGKSAGAVRVEIHRIIQNLKHRYLRITGESSDGR